MDELTKTDLALFFDEEIYLIKEKENTEPTKEVTPIEQPVATPNLVEDSLPAPLVLNYKGENKKGIAIIINDDSNEYLNTTDETLLLNILKAIGLSLEDVAIINQHNSGTKWQDHLDFTKALVFGILPSSYNVVTENFVINTKEEANWLFSDSLFALGNDKVLKGKLWICLQEFFK